MANPGARYGAEHRRKRAMVVPNAVAAGWPCARCGVRLRPGDQVDLDHSDDGQSYIGPSHRTCNTRAGGAKGNARQRDAAKAERDRRRRRFVRVAVAVSRGRDGYLSIGLAAELEDENYVLLELVYGRREHLLAELVEELGVTGITVDPRSVPKSPPPPGVAVVKPPWAAVDAAQWALEAGLRAGRVRHVEHPRLTEAVRGGRDVDVSPLRAVALAYSSLVNVTPSV